MRRARRLLPAALAAAAISLAAAAGSDGPPPAPDAGDLPSAWRDGVLRVPKGLPAPWIPPFNPITEAKVALGRRLFFDRSLSRDRTRSCADCHVPGACFTDERRTALGVREQVGTRNTPSLVNAALYPALFWDGRAVSLEAQVEGPLLAPTELDMTEDLVVARVEEQAEYRPLLRAAFGSEDVSLRRLGHALASFQRTLLSADSPFDRWWWGGERGAVSDAAKRGFDLFRTKASCVGCHDVGPSEAVFTDFGFHATGAGSADDAGRAAATGRAEDHGRFRTPSLRNVAATGPYFHDGSAATLADVIEHYDRGGRPPAKEAPAGATGSGSAPAPARKVEISPLGLSDAEKRDLEAFLRTLTSPGFVECPLPKPSAEPAR